MMWFLLPPVLCGLTYGMLPLGDEEDGPENNLLFFFVWLPIAGMLAGWGLSNLGMCCFNMFTSERSKIYHRFNVQIRKELHEEDFFKESERLHKKIREEKDEGKQLELLREFKKREEDLVSQIMKTRDLELVPHQKKRTRITLIYSLTFTVVIISLYLLFSFFVEFPTTWGYVFFSFVAVLSAIAVFFKITLGPMISPPKGLETIGDDKIDYKEKVRR